MKPFFPLSVFLLPGEDIPLRIFEPRYLQLIEEAKEDGFTFVIPFLRDDDVTSFGCEVKLRQVVAETSQGKKVITVESLALVRIISFRKQAEGKLYPAGVIERIDHFGGISNRELMQLVIHYTDEYDHEFLEDADENNLGLLDIARALNLSSDDKYDFITLSDPFLREQFLINQMRYLMLIRKQEQLLGNDFGLN